jgi:uncharacterized protein (TIGR03435 family)
MKLLLAALGMAAMVRAQTAAPLRFDVASVKVSDKQYLVIFPERSGGRVTWTTDLWYMLGYAYRLELWRISGPVPDSTNVYRVDAVTDPNATDDQVRLMFQSLLADRFKMAVHRVEKEVDGYALTVAKGGPKMEETKDGDKPAALPEWMRKHSADAADMEGHVVATVEAPGVAAITGRRITMLQFSEALQRVLSVAVFDQTGLTGKYYLAFEFAQPDHPTDAEVPDLFSAVKELGLRLEKRRGPVEMLVVDRIEKTPTGN